MPDKPYIEQRVLLKCPYCGLVWEAAIIRPEDHVTAERIAKQCYCPRCTGHPPMQIARVDVVSS